MKTTNNTTNNRHEIKSEMFEGCSKDLCFVHNGRAYPVKAQSCTPFNDAAGVPESPTPKLGHITEGVYYYPWTDEAMGETNAGFTKEQWAASGYEVLNT